VVEAMLPFQTPGVVAAVVAVGVDVDPLDDPAPPPQAVTVRAATRAVMLFASNELERVMVGLRAAETTARMCRCESGQKRERLRGQFGGRRRSKSGAPNAGAAVTQSTADGDAGR
jgi:hypothetical protein